MFEPLGLYALESKAEDVALAVQKLHAITRPVEEKEKYRVEYREFDAQGSQTINGFSKVDRLGVQLHLSIFASSRIMADGLRNEIGCAASGPGDGFEFIVHGALKDVPRLGRYGWNPLTCLWPRLNSCCTARRYRSHRFERGVQFACSCSSRGINLFFAVLD